MTEPTPRRSQAERRATTRGQLIDAALASLVEQGWSATTSVEVCARAGVTRGAFVHHFDSLAELLAAALQSVYDDVTAHRTKGDVRDLVDVLDVMWGAVGHPRFKAVIEAWLAMANDPSLAAEIGPVVAGFAKFVDAEQLLPSILKNETAKTHYLLAREAMLGLALGRATNGGKPLKQEKAVLATLRSTASSIAR